MSTRYKARAEAWGDAFRLLGALEALKVPHERYEIETHETHGVNSAVVSFSSSESIERLREILGGLTDCHVLAETLAPAEHYTGKRSWEVS